MEINNCCFSLRGYNKACWIIEKNCNLNCEFCFHNQFGTIEQIDEKRFDEYPKIISALKKRNIRHVILSGGEPLLSSELFNIINILEINGFTVSISTNAILATPQFCNRLKNTSVEKLTVNLAAICDKEGKIVKNQHSINIIDGIRNLTSYGFSITLNNILHTSTTRESILQNIECACRWGAKTISFTIPVCKCSFYSRSENSSYFIDNRFAQQLLIYVQEIEHEIAPQINIEFNYPNCTSDKCPANHQIFGVSIDGNVSTCLVKQYQKT